MTDAPPKPADTDAQRPAPAVARRKPSMLVALRRRLRQGARAALAALPAQARSGLYRNMVDTDAAVEGDFVLKIAESQAELEACFSLLHDAYVSSGFMRPHPSGLRVTPYHALPTTTTLCAKVGERVVGTLSIVREGVFGFPMQSAFDISQVRAKEGRIAEISALAVHPRYRKTGGAILFPLMKFMYEYCTRFFDTRHLVIAVNPARIDLYESLLLFSRLTAEVVDRYDFANGAPAVGATLDLHAAPALFERAYAHKADHRNLHRYFAETTLEQIHFPERPWHTSNDPVLTPALVDYFFNVRTQGFAELDERRKQLLHQIYRGGDWARVLPPLQGGATGSALRRSPRHSLKCPALLDVEDAGAAVRQAVTIIDISSHGFQARVESPLAIGKHCTVEAQLGSDKVARVRAQVVRPASAGNGNLFGFHVAEPDSAWQHCVAWLEAA